MPTDSLTLVRLADTAALALFLVRLVTQGLAKIYWPLALHVTLEFIEAIASFTIPLRSNAYGYFYMATCIPRWTLWLLVLLGLQDRSLQATPALRTFTLWGTRGAIAASLILVLMTGWIDYRQYGPGNVVIPVVYFTERTVTTMLGFLLVGLLGILAWFRVPVSRNVSYFSLGLGLIFASRASLYAVRNYLGNSGFQTMNMLSIGLSCLVFLYWAVAINRQGEETVRMVTRRLTPDEMEAATRRLAGVSAALKAKN